MNASIFHGLFSMALGAIGFVASFSGLASAQVSPTPPFVGTTMEDFEDVSIPGGLEECVDLAVGQACSEAGATALGLADNLVSTGCTLGAFDGDTFLLKVDGSIPVLGSNTITFEFNAPVARFGARFIDAGVVPSTLNARFFDANGTEIASLSSSLSGACAWEWTGYAASAGFEFSRLELEHLSPEGIGLMIDSIQVDAEGDGGSLGTTYCVAAPNSVGQGAQISASGSTSVAVNSLFLSAQAVPNQPGLFYYGPEQILLPFGDGFRCVGGVVGRLPISAANIGVLSVAVDFQNPPSAATQITAGSTWNFQAWYRDPAAGGSGFNLSNGVELTFQP